MKDTKITNVKHGLFFDIIYTINTELLTISDGTQLPDIEVSEVQTTRFGRLIRLIAGTVAIAMIAYTFCAII